MDSETKPYDFITMEVNITDAGNNVLSRETHFRKDDLLVFENSFTITEDPFIGDWILSVQVDDDPEATKKIFEIREYVLPRFEAFADTKEFIPLSDREINVVVYAKYNFGEYVKGKAKVTAKMYDSKFPESVKQQKQFLIANISTKKQLVIKLREHLKIVVAIRDIIVKIEVEFEEELTKKTISVEKSVIVQKGESFQIKVFRPQLKLKPGFPYEFKVVVRKADGSLESYHGDVKIKVSFFYSLEKCSQKKPAHREIKEFARIIQKKLTAGSVNFGLDVPQNTSAMSLNIGYYDTKHTVNVLRFPSKTRDYLEAKIKTNER